MYNTERGLSAVLITFHWVTLEIIKILAVTCLSCVFFDTGFRIYYTIKGGKVIFLFSVATSPIKAKTSKKQKPLWTNWSK